MNCRRAFHRHRKCLHAWDFLTPVEEVMRAFDDLVSSGKILCTGISDTPAWIVAEANMLAELRGWTRFAGLQINYSLLERTPSQIALCIPEEHLARLDEVSKIEAGFPHDFLAFDTVRQVVFGNTHAMLLNHRA